MRTPGDHSQFMYGLCRQITSFYGVILVTPERGCSRGDLSGIPDSDRPMELHQHRQFARNVCMHQRIRGSVPIPWSLRAAVRYTIEGMRCLVTDDRSLAPLALQSVISFTDVPTTRCIHGHQSRMGNERGMTRKGEAGAHFETDMDKSHSSRVIKTRRGLVTARKLYERCCRYD
jgi:hypothetical protein